MGAGEKDKVVCCNAIGFGFRIECIAGDYQGRCVGRTTSLGRDSSGLGTCKTKDIGKRFGCNFLNDCESWGDLINMKLKEFQWSHSNSLRK